MAKCKANGKLVEEYKVRDDGYEAAEMGVSRDANPHHIKSRAWRLWDYGWENYDLDIHYQEDVDN
jgi:hypothetical protein